MGRDVRLFLRKSKYIFWFFFCAFLTGCATSARDLPVDYGSIHAKQRLEEKKFDPVLLDMNCSQIDKALQILEHDYQIQAKDIYDKRQQNQVAGYFGGMLILPLLATDNSFEAKEKIEKINQAKDQLYQLRSFKKCSVTTK